MKITFDAACDLSGTEFHLLRQRADSEYLFDAAVESMRKERWTCDTETGTTRSRGGVQAQFVAYDWGAEYDAAPQFVFYDFFRCALLNKYSRLMRGLPA